MRPVAGKYYTGLVSHPRLGTCEVYLAGAPESVLRRLRAMRAGVHAIHNDAPRSLRQVEEIIERIDVPALQDAGVSIHQIGPTQHGYVRVAVERDAPAAQAKLDAMLGPNVTRIVEARMAQTLPYRGPGTPED